MVTGNINSELLQTLTEIGNQDHEQPTDEPYTEESLSRRYKLLSKELKQTKKTWKMWLKQLKEANGPIEQAAMTKI